MVRTTNFSPTYARFAIQRFLDWWRSRLVELVPRTLSSRLASGDGLVQANVTINDDAISVTLPGQVPTAGRDAEIILNLPANAALIQQTRYPMDVANMVPDLLMAEIDRVTPFDSQNVTVAQRICGHDWSEREIVVEFAAVRTDTLERIFAAARQAGLDPTGAVVEGGDQRLVFSAADLQPVSGRRAAILSRINWWFAATVTALAVALVLPTVMMKQHRVSIEADLEILRAQAERGAEVTEQVNSFERSRSFIDEQLSANVSPMLVLSQLSQLMPTQSWLSNVNIQGDRVVMRGSAQSASEVVSALTASALFSDVQYSSGASRDPRTNLEDFEVTATLSGQVDG